MDGLKQRIVGALVLVALAVIFVPMVFDEPHTGRTSTSITIPEEPPFPEVEGSFQQPETKSLSVTGDASAEPDGDVQAASAGSAPGYRLLESEEAPVSAAEPEAEKPVATQPAPVAPEPVASAPETSSQPVVSGQKETIDYSGSLAGAWVVQLGSFGNTENARRLRDKVREKGYGSHLQDVVRGDTRLTRVFSGPFVTKADAEAAKRVLDQAFNLNSLVTTGDK